MDDPLSQAALRRPGAPALAAPDGAATYAQLEERAGLAARRLAAMGVGPGDRVATTLGPSLAFAELLHALPRLGAALVPLNTRLPAPGQRRQAAAAGATLTIDEPLFDGFEAQAPELERDPEATWVVMFTSGTSGVPKPVELSIANLEASAAASAAVLGAEDGDRWLCALPLFHVAGLSILVRAALAGAGAVLHPRFDAAAVAGALASGEITLASLVPTQLRRVAAAAGLEAPGLRALLLGGGPVAPDLLELARSAGVPARCTYGMTETASQVVLTEPWETAGRPLPGVSVVAAGDGELLVRGPMVSRGALAADGWLHTGDAGHVDRHGRVHVRGRIAELIITGGEKVAPAAVEAALGAHPGVDDAAVAGVPDADWGEAVTAWIVERRPVSDYDLLAFCRERLAAYELPKRIHRVRRLPRNATGKLLRSQLSEPATGHRAPGGGG